MKNIIYIIIFVFLLIGCNQRQSWDLLLDNVAKTIEINPDSAQSLLDDIPSPQTLNDKSFARWCMLSGKITDKIHTLILPTYHFERVYKWFWSEGDAEEQAQILLYLGRSYVKDGD